MCTLTVRAVVLMMDDHQRLLAVKDKTRESQLDTFHSAMSTILGMRVFVFFFFFHAFSFCIHTIHSVTAGLCSVSLTPALRMPAMQFSLRSVSLQQEFTPSHGSEHV